MKFEIDGKRKLAKVWCSHADKQDTAKQETLAAFITDCRKRKFLSAFLNRVTEIFWKTQKNCSPIT